MPLAGHFCPNPWLVCSGPALGGRGMLVRFVGGTATAEFDGARKGKKVVMHKRSSLRTGHAAWPLLHGLAVAVLLAVAPGAALAADGTPGVATPALGGSDATPPQAVATPPATPAAPAAAITSTAAVPPAGDDANGKPLAADLKDALKGPHLKRKLARGAPRPKAGAAAVTPPPGEAPGFFDTLFGSSGAPPAGPNAAVAGTDPATTAAIDQARPDAVPLTKGKRAKGIKTAKNSPDKAVPANAALPDAGLFGNEDAPFASGELGYPLLSPSNIEPLKAAIKRYTDIVARGGWPTVPPLQMEVNTNNAAVTILRQRLAVEGDLEAQPSSFWGPTYFDQELADALKHFQDRYGLNPTGDLMDVDRLKNGTRTVMALNVAAEARLAQLKANLTRMQSQVIAKGRYVLVNIPGEQIEAVENNQVVLRLNGVVGKPERPSPLLSSNIEEIKFNPIWTLPPTVVKEDLIPKGRSLHDKGVDVLAKFGIDAYDGNGKKLDTSTINWSSESTASLRFSQQPGKDNPLGFAKLDFASPESVYMHDTPSSKLFDKSYRAASSGCIRVDHMDRLTAWLLKETDGWSASRVLDMKGSGVSQIVRLKRAVPLHWVYITAWATQDGVVHFRRDLYGKDQAFGVSETASAY